MTDIKNRIEKIKEYFVGMNVQTLDDGTQAIYIIVKLPKSWTVPDEITEKYGVTVQEADDRKFYFGASMEDGFETIFDSIDYTIKVMKEAEERAKLLSEKIEELKKIFNDENNSVNYLKNLEFSFKNKRKPKKINNKEKEEIIDNTTCQTL